MSDTEQQAQVHTFDFSKVIPKEKPKASLQALLDKSKQRGEAIKLGKQLNKDGNVSKQSLLHGTGFTKRAGEKQEKVWLNPQNISKALERDFNEIKLEEVLEISGDDVTPILPVDGEILPPTIHHRLGYPEPGQTPEQAITVLEAPKIEETETNKLPILRADSSLWDDEVAFDDSQWNAINGTLENQYAVIIGPAGSGKSTITQAVLRRLEHLAKEIRYSQVIHDKETGETRYIEETSLSIALCAPTGAAVKVLRTIFPMKYRFNCATIHKLLGFHPEFYETTDEHGNYKDTMRFVPYYTKYHKLPHNIIILDEASMCTVALWNQLWEACEPGTRIIMVGDINQLPPVYGKSILGFTMQTWPTFELETIHRNAGLIVRNAARTLAGNPGFEQIKAGAPVTYNRAAPDEIFQVIQLPKRADQAYEFARKALMVLARDGLFNYRDDIFIVPENAREHGRESFNEDLGAYFNKNKRISIHTGTKPVLYAVGDKVMLIKNLNDKGLTNGMIGWVKEININGAYINKGNQFNPHGSTDKLNSDFSMEDLIKKATIEAKQEKNEAELGQRQASHIVTVRFEDRVEHAFKSSNDYTMLTHSYAITCHKSQGAEYPTVVILCHHFSSILLSREWLYTAITRAKTKVFLLCSDRGLDAALSTQRISGNTLEEKIKSFVVSDDTKDVNVPVIPDAQPVNVKD